MLAAYASRLAEPKASGVQLSEQEQRWCEFLMRGDLVLRASAVLKSTKKESDGPGDGPCSCGQQEAEGQLPLLVL